MPTSPKQNPAEVLALRITVVDPPPKTSWALQLGRDTLVRPTSSTESRVSFDFSAEVVGDSGDGFRLRGPAVQGRPGERFVYLCVGSYAGDVGAQANSGRTKISLESITKALIEAAKATGSGLLEAQFAGTARNGGPARASVPLLGEGWRLG